MISSPPKPCPITYPRRKPLRLPKGKAVTICIAAISSNNPGQDPYIVTASDTKLNGGIIAADSMTVKLEPFHKEWFAMISGDDITQCLPIIEKAGQYFEGRANKIGTARAVFRRAYSQHLMEMRENAALSRYGLTMREFLRTGKKRFSEKIFDSICKRMDEVKLDCTFLVAGFDSTGIPHVFEVSENKDGGIEDHVFDKPGFRAIGSGMYVAETILYSLNQTIDRNFYETIFNVCAAKFMAEDASDVGQATYILCKRRGTQTFRFNYGLVEDIREEWKKNGRPRVPEGIVKRIETIYHPRCE